MHITELATLYQHIPIAGYHICRNY